MGKARSHESAATDSPRPEEGEWIDVDVDIERLSARLRFKPDDGMIWLGGERMMLFHSQAFSSLRKELIETLGTEGAKKVLRRFGAVSGTLDAQIARSATPSAGAIESFKAGPRLHAIEGMVAPEEVRLELDSETGLHFGEWIWRNSVEAEAHLDAFGISGEPVCWTQIGYASAYSSAYMGHPIVYREVECRGMGAPHCRIVGKPAALWDDMGKAEEQLGIDLQVAEAGSSEHLSIASEYYDAHHKDALPDVPLIGESSSFATLTAMIRRVAATDAPVLVLGEPGVGKKSVAKAIRKLGVRASKPIVVVNCARQDDADLELDLFGRERTAECAARIGKLERANGGTLVLEDIHTLSPRIQAKLLQLLQEGQSERLGATQVRQLNIRVIACANEGLAEAVRNGRFRQDLYYRISVCPVPVPPLRERRTDLPLLIRHFLKRYQARHAKQVKGMTMDAVGYLLAHEFHGNLAELDAIIERAVIMTDPGKAIDTTKLISAADLYKSSFLQLSQAGALVKPEVQPTRRELALQSDRLLHGDFNLEAFEEELIERAVAHANGNLAHAARLLGITRPQLAYRYTKMRENRD